MMHQFETVGNHAGFYSEWNIAFVLMSLNPNGFGQYLHQWIIADVQKRLRQRFSRISVQSPLKALSLTKPAPKPTPASASPNSTDKFWHQMITLTKIGLERPTSLVLAVGVFAGQQLYQKVKSCWQYEDNHRIPALMSTPWPWYYPKLSLPQRTPNLDTALERFFVDQLDYTPQYATSLIVPLVRHIMHATPYQPKQYTRPRPSPFLCADSVSNAFYTSVIASEAARLSPRRQEWEYKRWVCKRFFINAHRPKSRISTKSELTTESTPEAESWLDVEKTAIEPISEPESDSAIDRLVSVPELDVYPSSSEAATADDASLSITICDQRLSTQVLEYHTIFSETKISFFDDGSVVVCKSAAEKELFPLLEDVRFLFEPRADEDEILQSVVELMSGNVRRGFQSRVKEGWKRMKKNVVNALRTCNRVKRVFFQKREC